jgi:hypothetical protein
LCPSRVSTNQIAEAHGYLLCMKPFAEGALVVGKE